MKYTGKIEMPENSLISYMSGMVKQHGGINLAQGIPGFPPPQGLLDELKSIIYDNCHQYPQGRGEPELIEVIRAIYNEITDIPSDRLLVVQGATEGISLVYTYLISRFGKNWSAMAFDPVYESYKELPKIFGNDLIRLQLESGRQPDWAKVEEQLAGNTVKLIFVNSPGNPYGRIWSEEEIDRLLVMAEKYDFYILFDAVYKDLYFGDVKPFIPLDKSSSRIFYVNSFSKMLSITGWRIGYLIADNEHLDKIVQIHDYTGLCAPSILQKAIAGYMSKNGMAKDYLLNLRHKLAAAYSFIAPELKKSGFLFPEVQGGYFIWAKLPAGYSNGFDFAISLYNRSKVAVVPGIHFSETAGSFLRINIAREVRELQEAVMGINSYLNG